MKPIRMLSAALLPLALPLTFAAAQGPVPAPKEVLDAFHLRAATIQELRLPASEPSSPWQRLDVPVVLAGAPRTLALRPHDMRAPGFRLLVDDGSSLRQLPSPAPVTWRGEVTGLAESVVAASLVAGRLSATVRLEDGKLWGIESLASQFPALPAAQHVVFEATDEQHPDARCGCPEHWRPIPVAGGPAPAAMKEAEIAIDCDLEYYQRYGSNTTTVTNQVNSVMNAVDVIYRRDCEITYRITAIMIRTTAIYSGTDMSSLLTQFRNYWNSNHGGVARDLAHYFTGKGSFSGVIGIAYLGVVCSVPNAYGVSKAFSSSLTTNAGLVAHETGHNWNAPHCDATPPCYIMCSGLGGCSGNITLFDPNSRNVIVAFKNSRTCLSDPLPPNPPTLTSLTPTNVTSYQPAQVTLTGTYLDAITKVTVGGTDHTSFQVVNSTTVRFTPNSPFTIATHPVTVSNARGTSNPLNLTIDGNHPSVFVAPVFALRGFPMDYKVHSDRSWRALLLLSDSNQPSVLPGIVTLGLGNAFSSLYVVGDLPAANDGLVLTQLIVPTIVPSQIVFYWQAVTYDPNNLVAPLETSNVAMSTTF